MQHKYQFSNGVVLYKWEHAFQPTEQLMQKKLEEMGFRSYDLQTCPPWFERSLHAHDYEEIRAAVSGCITFHFSDLPITVEAGDVIVIPSFLPHEVKVHNSLPFQAFKGSRSGERHVTEYGDGMGSVEDLERRNKFKIK